MATKQLMVNCSACAKPTLHVAQTPTHVVHLLLSIITAGFWLIVWIFLSIGTPKPQCTICGKKNSSHKSFSLSS